jgi:thiol-disulfide isomerase/thioredoxin
VAESAGGTAVRLSDLRGKVVLLDFWATWCAPCVKDVPRLKALVESLADEEAFAVIGVSLDRDRGALDAFVRKHDLRWPQAFDGSGWDNAVANAYRVQAIPHVVLVDRQGRVARRGVRGPDLDAAVRALLAAPGEPGEPVAPASTGSTGPTGATPGAR